MANSTTPTGKSAPLPLPVGSESCNPAALPTFGTTIRQSGWQGGSVYFAIRCEEHPGEKPNDTSTKEDDSVLWYGDCVEILLETESRSTIKLPSVPRA